MEGQPRCHWSDVDFLSGHFFFFFFSQFAPEPIPTICFFYMSKSNCFSLIFCTFNWPCLWLFLPLFFWVFIVLTSITPFTRILVKEDHFMSQLQWTPCRFCQPHVGKLFCKQGHVWAAWAWIQSCPLTSLEVTGRILINLLHFLIRKVAVIVFNHRIMGHLC